MAEKIKMSQKDSALISILERMSDQLRKLDQSLEDTITRQAELTKAAEVSEIRVAARQAESGAAIGKLQDSISRYRSDMLKLVNEQDHINKNMTELNKLVNKTVYAMENANSGLAGLEERVTSHDRMTGENFTYTIKQSELLQKELAASNRNMAKLHIETEKNLGKMHQDTQRQLLKLQQETTRRLMVLDDIEIALQTLLIRTEPPEKKPNRIVRLFRRAAGFFRPRLSRLLNRIQPQKKD